MSDDVPSTSLWLLLGLGKAEERDQAAWLEFSNRYGPHIVRWCRQAGLSEPDAQEAAQGALIRLMKAMQTFVYDPEKRFRGYLRKTTNFAIGDVQRAFAKRPLPVSDTQLQKLPGGTPRPEEEIIALEDKLLRDLAVARTKESVAPLHWQVFEMRLNGVSRDEVAKQLGLSTGKVSTVYGRVAAVLQRTIQQLEEG